MILSQKVITLRKYSVEHRFCSLSIKSLEALLPIPDIFRYIVPMDILVHSHKRSFSNKDFCNTIQMLPFNAGTSFYLTDYIICNTPLKTIKLNHKLTTSPNYNRINKIIPNSIGYKFEIYNSKGEIIPIGWFSPENSYLAVAIEQNSKADNALSNISINLTQDYICVIKEIFKYITQNKLGMKNRVFKPAKYKIGCDIEFSLVKNDKSVSAADLLKGGTTSPLGNDGHNETGEMRPQPYFSPESLVDRGITPLIKELSRRIPPDIKVTTGGGLFASAPLGDHIHFGKILSVEEIKLLDYFVGIPSIKMNGGARSNESYGFPGDVRYNAHGCEYRTCPSGLIPSLLKSRYIMCFNLLKFWESMPVGATFTFKVAENEVPTLNDYLTTVTQEKYRGYIEEFYKWVTTGSIDVSENIIKYWVNPSGKSNRIPRAEITVKPTWFKHPTRIPVKGLKSRKEVEIKSFSNKDIPEITDPEEFKSTVLIELPQAVTELAEKGDKRVLGEINSLTKKLKCTIGIKTNYNDSVNIFYPFSWRNKTKIFTPNVVRQIVRLGLEEKGESKCVV